MKYILQFIEAFYNRLNKLSELRMFGDIKNQSHHTYLLLIKNVFIQNIAVCKMGVSMGKKIVAQCGSGIKNNHMDLMKMENLTQFLIFPHLFSYKEERK